MAALLQVLQPSPEQAAISLAMLPRIFALFPPQAARSAWGLADAGTRRAAGFAAAGGQHVAGMC